MPRISLVESATASDEAKEVLDRAKKAFGRVPNLLKAMAHSPAVVRMYLDAAAALGGGALDAKLGERISLADAEANGCAYCCAAHAAIGRSVGLTDEQIMESRRGSCAEAEIDAVLRFVQAVRDKRGSVSDADLEAVRKAGYNDAQIVEMVAHVALDTLTNYFNKIAQTPLDFPQVAPLT